MSGYGDVAREANLVRCTRTRVAPKAAERRSAASSVDRTSCPFTCSRRSPSFNPAAAAIEPGATSQTTIPTPSAESMSRPSRLPRRGLKRVSWCCATCCKASLFIGSIRPPVGAAIAFAWLSCMLPNSSPSKQCGCKLAAGCCGGKHRPRPRSSATRPGTRSELFGGCGQEFSGQG